MVACFMLHASPVERWMVVGGGDGRLEGSGCEFTGGGWPSRHMTIYYGNFMIGKTVYCKEMYSKVPLHYIICCWYVPAPVQNLSETIFSLVSVFFGMLSHK